MPYSECSTIALTGIRVPRSTGAPLCTRGLTSTKGHSDQSIFSSAAIATPPNAIIACSRPKGAQRSAENWRRQPPTNHQGGGCLRPKSLLQIGRPVHHQGKGRILLGQGIDH